MAEIELAKIKKGTISPTALINELNRERDILKSHESELWQHIEQSYLAAFPGAPYTFDVTDAPMSNAINTQEAFFVEKVLRKELWLAITLVGINKKKDWGLDRNIYFLPAMRANSRIPYHLLKLGPPESGPAVAFGNMVANLAVGLLPVQ